MKSNRIKKLHIIHDYLSKPKYRIIILSPIIFTLLSPSISFLTNKYDNFIPYIMIFFFILGILGLILLNWNDDKRFVNRMRPTYFTKQELRKQYIKKLFENEKKENI